ncbi:hypothetical protein AXF42_Ash005219 [Apostasia shenzhenica]|uniref:Uncharacterized protein n=1 Tax=Apostasia shenzhenica TaxID=1088818 RepID=A0A2I0B6A2_9ASPA|nr:hypothetical protein AXF42_Ash005219 [Apostasia shenzhenica]
MAVPGYGGCLTLQSKMRKMIFSGTSSSHSNWRDYYFFVGGDLGIPLTPGTCLPEFVGDAKWMAGQDTLKNLERLKGWSWPLKDFLRHMRNDVSLHAKTLGYVVLREVATPPGTVLMKKVRRGEPPAAQLSREIIEVGEEEEIGVPDPVCGGTAVDVVSSPEDTTDDRKILAELGYTGKGKEPVSAVKPQTIPKGAKGIIIGEKEEGNEANRGQEKEGTEGPCLDLILSEVPEKKRSPSESTSLEPPNKKVKSVEEEGFVAGGEHDWQRSVEPPYSTNFAGIFGDEGTRIAVRTKGNDRRLIVVTVPTANKNCVYRGEVGLALGSGLVSKDLEEKLEKTSTPDLYSNFANRIATVGILSRPFSPV